MSFKRLSLFFTLYFLSFGLMLFNQGIFWDDWVLIDQEKTVIINMFKQMGLPIFGYWHVFLLSLPKSVLIYRLITFFSFFFSVLFLDEILKKIKKLNSKSRFFILAFFMFFPVNSARLTLICLPYTLSYLLFFFAFYLTSKYLEKNNLWIRIISLICFFISFFTNSLLVFYLIVILFLLYQENKPLKVLPLLKFTSRYPDFLCLPLIFWLIRHLYFLPFGMYQNYHQITLQNLATIPLNIFLAFYYSFIEVINNSISLNLFQLINFAFIFSIFFIIFLNFKKNYQLFNYKMFAFGCLAFISAVLPYLAVGIIPRTKYDWANRHQLLVPLGASFILYFSLRILFHKLKWELAVEKFIFWLLIIIFVNANILQYLELQKDWYKQVSLMEHFKIISEVQNHNSFIFIDNTKDLNYNQRNYRFYEFSGLFKFVFNNETRFASELRRVNKEINYTNPSIFNTEKSKKIFIYYKMKDYQPKNFEYKVFINHGEIELNNKNVFKFIFWEYFQPDKFEKEVIKILKLDYLKMES